MKVEVVIVGAGLAGLCCARHLKREGVSSLLIEASDAVGGRLRTDIVDGFRLDRGFQVFLDSYPEAKAVLDFKALQLRKFLPGAMVRFQGRFHPIIDPWRDPLSSFKSIFNPIGSLLDKVRVAMLRGRSCRGTIADRFSEIEEQTLSHLRSQRFSSEMIDRFFRPFLGGIFLDADLVTSSRMLNFVFRMFATGEACLPSNGMQAIATQLASHLSPDNIRLNTSVCHLSHRSVKFDSGEAIEADRIVIATDAPAAEKLIAPLSSPDPSSMATRGRGVTCLYFSANRSPLSKPILVLNGDGIGPINNLCVPTDVCPSYGPAGKSLISVTVLGCFQDRDRLQDQVKTQLEEWFGNDVHSWQHLRTYSIPYALPDQSPPALSLPERPVRLGAGIYVCGDHRDQASIQGAMVSGRRAAEAILEDYRCTTN
jgi:phytoene dehydrogenase-like protein